MLGRLLATTISIVPISKLDPTTRDAMWALYAPHHHMDRDSFDARLASLDEVALFELRRDRGLIGFSGFRSSVVELDGGRVVAAFYMGLTYIDPGWRSTSLIPRMVIKRMVRPWLSPAYRAVYFWTDCLTYRPYLVMTRNLHEYYPHRERGMSAEAKELRDHLGHSYYGDNFDPDRGTVKKPGPRVRDHERTITSAELEDPDVRWYLHLNPNYDRGDGVIALCPATAQNVAYCCVRKIRHGWRASAIRQDRRAVG